MPNLASRNHSGAWYCLSESQVGWKAPGAIGRGFCHADARLIQAAGTAPANSFVIERLPIFMAIS
jgi:hypothetical protein